MSGIVGMFHLDGRPAESRLVARMLGALSHRGPDASRVWVDGAIGLGHCLLATTPEAIGEVQPLAADGLSIVFDGRLDNRAELRHALAPEPAPAPGGSDAAFVMAAYRRWDVECAARLLGDFAFAIWDANRRRMFCARDVMAQKPFYYHLGPSLFLFASEPQALLRHPSISRRINEGMAGEYLSIVTSTTDTLFADVQRLAPAHRLAVSSRACRLDRYWDIEAPRTIRYKAIDDYTDHLRGLLRQVVADRLRSTTDTGVLLSGGIDSSSLLATATQLRRSGTVSSDCRAFSLIDPGGPLDEQPFMNATLAALGCDSHRFEAAPQPVDAYRDATRLRADLASSPSARLMDAVRAGARRQNVRVLLSGIGGDEWFGGSPYHAADLLRSGRWIALGGYLRSAWSSGAIADVRSAATVMAWPLLPRTSRKRIKRWLRHDAVPPWIAPDFATRIGLADRLYPPDPDPPFPTIAQRAIFRNMRSGLSIHGFEDDERSAAESGLEVRYPFADRRVMEFGLAIPEDMRRLGGVRKVVLREAMRGCLPDEVRLRDTSPNGGSAFMETLAALAREGLFDRPLIEREGWTGTGHVRVFYERIESRRAAGDPDYTDDVWPLWCVATVELWMREVANRPADNTDNEEARCEMTTALTSAR